MSMKRAADVYEESLGSTAAAWAEKAGLLPHQHRLQKGMAQFGSVACRLRSAQPLDWIAPRTGSDQRASAVAQPAVAPTSSAAPRHSTFATSDGRARYLSAPGILRPHRAARPHNALRAGPR